MTATEKAIRDAIEGGWGINKLPYDCTPGDVYLFVTDTQNYGFLLDPKFWEALGKVRGWKQDHLTSWEPCKLCGGQQVMTDPTTTWQYKMDGLIPALRRNLSIEAYLKSIE